MHKCIYCGEHVPDYEPEYCCSGWNDYWGGCGCHGLPISVCICEQCQDKIDDGWVEDENQQLIPEE